MINPLRPVLETATFGYEPYEVNGTSPLVKWGAVLALAAVAWRHETTKQVMLDFAIGAAIGATLYAADEALKA